MPPAQPPTVMVVCESIAEASRLLILLSSLTKRIVTCTSYREGIRLLECGGDQGGYDLVFLSLPANGNGDEETAVRLLALALAHAGPQRTVLLAGGRLPHAFTAAGATDDQVMERPVTRDKLRHVLEPLGLTLPRLNCWQYMNCGRQPGGRHADDRGVCPAAAEAAADGIHGGTAGGRCCWAISGTFCGGCVQGTFAAKIANCLECDFYKTVQAEEGYYFESIDSILNRIRHRQKDR